jgi:hypothetical protein
LVSRNIKNAFVIGFAIFLGSFILIDALIVINLVIALNGTDWNNSNYGGYYLWIAILTLLSIGFGIALNKVRKIRPDSEKNPKPSGPISGMIQDQPSYQPDPKNIRNSWTFRLSRSDPNNGNPLPSIWIRMEGKDLAPGWPENNDIVHEVVDPSWDDNTERYTTDRLRVERNAQIFWISVIR